jgi:uncharacterized 2Fe-2S/4Fe-4S cluster protein (DUF4445 family)
MIIMAQNKKRNKKKSAKKKSTKPGIRKPGFFRISFLSGYQRVENPEGETLLETMRKADILINADCGGAGTCGKCRVKILRGNYLTTDTNLQHSGDEDGEFVKACTVVPESDLVVEIPKSSVLLKTKPIPEHYEKIDISGFPYKMEPLVRKYYLEIPPPSASDNLNDLERLYRTLTEVTGIENFTIDYRTLMTFTELVREADWKVTVTLCLEQKPALIFDVEEDDTTSEQYAIVIDLGTTTIEALLVDTNKKIIISSVSKLNPQVEYGSDLLSRLNYFKTMRELVDENSSFLSKLKFSICIDEIIKELIAGTGVFSNRISSVFISGNTFMIHFLLGFETEFLRKQPHVPAALSYPVFTGLNLKILELPFARVFISPGIGAYVGGDLVSSLVATGMPGEDFLLVDIGTNSEAAAVVDGNVICAATSAGPAFEGGGIKNGMRAVSGAINKVNYNPETCQFEFTTIDGYQPTGICGTGLIDTLASLLLAGLVDKKGKLRNKPGHLCIKSNNGVDEIVIHEQAAGDKISVTDQDIDYLVKSKGALFAGTDFLLKAAGKTFDEMSKYYIAGALGGYINVESGVMIGLFPDIDRKRFEFLGNSSLIGGLMQLMSCEARKKALEIAQSSAYVELSDEPAYMNGYTSTLFLPHTEMDRFPGVMSILADSERTE